MAPVLSDAELPVVTGVPVGMLSVLPFVFRAELAGLLRLPLDMEFPLAGLLLFEPDVLGMLPVSGVLFTLQELV